MTFKLFEIFATANNVLARSYLYNAFYLAISVVMIVYEVNLRISRSVETQFKDWLERHVKEMLCFDGFDSMRIYESIDEENLDLNLVVHYQVLSQDYLNRYFEEHAARMRQDGMDHFKDQFAATRRILLTESDVN